MNKIKEAEWRDLNSCVLSQIFGLLSLQDQLFGAPFVCHSWLDASLHTIFKHPNLDLSCMQNLDDHQQLSRFIHLLKLAIKHCKNWVSLCLPPRKMPDFYTLMFIAENTPCISRVTLPANSSVDVYPVFMAVMYWKNLRVFHAPFRGIQFVSQLMDYCKKIVELGLHGEFSDRDVCCIVEGFPGLRALDLSNSTLSVNAVAVILDGRLKCIRDLNVLHCVFLDEEGKDVRENYAKMKLLRLKILEMVSGSKSLKKVMHCLGKSCEQCMNRSLGG